MLLIVMCHVTHYNSFMIKSFADKRTELLFSDGFHKAFPSEVSKRIIRKLDMIDAAIRIEDLRVPPGNRLHALIGDRQGQHSISVNSQWRICFRFEDQNAYDVEVCDYH